MTDKSVFQDLLSSDQFREEFFVAEAQTRLGELLEDKAVSRAELARRLGVSRARVTQIFSDESKNFTLRLLVRSFLALGEEPMVIARSEYERLLTEGCVAARQSPSENSTNLDGFTQAVVANLLRASVGEQLRESKGNKRHEDAKSWATAGSNVVPFEVRKHG